MTGTCIHWDISSEYWVKEKLNVLTQMSFGFISFGCHVFS